MSLTNDRYSGNATITFFEDEATVGCREVYCCGYQGPDGITRSAYWPNIAHFCRQCGQLWAREVYTFHFSYLPLIRKAWIIREHRCLACQGGDLLTDEQLASADPQLLRREFLAELERYA